METAPQELIKELRHLRQAFHESLAAYGSKIEGRIMVTIQSVQEFTPEKTGNHSKSNHPQKLSTTRTREIQVMIKRIQDLKMKPKKGRRKDLHRVEDAVSDLLTRIDEWS